MGWFVSRKTHEAEMLRVKREAAVLADMRQTALTDLGVAFQRQAAEVKAQAEALAATQLSTKEAWTRANVARTGQDAAEARIKGAEEGKAAAEAECARVCACHVGRVRIFTMPIDAFEMTARARVVEGSVRVQWSADEKALVGDAGGPLTDAQYNAVVAAIAPQFNRT